MIRLEFILDKHRKNCRTPECILGTVYRLVVTGRKMYWIVRCPDIQWQSCAMVGTRLHPSAAIGSCLQLPGDMLL